MKWILTLCLFASSVFGSEFPLLKRLEKAKAGDYIVFEANKTITLLAIRSLTNHSMVLEEISAPAPKNKPESWAAWLQAKAPGHTSWSMIEIDLKAKEILECYSFSRCAWLSQSPKDSFLATLLHLPLIPVEAKDRRKIGPAPQEGEADHRKVWNPPLVINGKKVEGTFDAYQTDWPQDGSELAGKNVCLYFDRNSNLPLPCWIQVDTGQVTGSLRAIDSGHRLPASPYRNMPRRIPEFVGSPVKTKNGIRLSIKSPKYYKTFELFAVDVTTGKEKQIHLVSHSLAEGQGEILNLEVDAEELYQVLQPDHKYTWLLVPAGHSGSYTELAKPFTWQ